ncbi:hypothetical protein GJAV_G00057770 [Gymnothorax javanicus]|nr:hypothetical protein GJAV_G00057770 [Gymnothorax javanicus]
MSIAVPVGPLASNGTRWRDLRRFSIVTLKTFGMGRKSIEERVQEEARFLVDAFREIGDSAFNPNNLLRNAVSNVICSIVFGKRFEYNSPQFKFLQYGLEGYFEFLSSSKGQLFNVFPNLMWCLPGSHHKLFPHLQRIRDYFRQEAGIRAETFDANCPRDYIEAFLVQMQEKEIDEVVGSARAPSIQDRQDMPYTDAVIHEIQRSMDLAPTVQWSSPLLSLVLSDPKLWKNPHVFDPENFLSEDGTFEKNDAFLPFGLGKRACLGEGLARVELFLSSLPSCSGSPSSGCSRPRSSTPNPAAAALDGCPSSTTATSNSENKRNALNMGVHLKPNMPFFIS